MNKAYVKDGVEYGKVKGSFRHRWWNYYERGISFSNGRFFEEAISDFEDAVDQRSKDQRMARTYGMHFVDYFPHRELGIVYFETGNFEQAREELLMSIETFPSAKAYFYLDRVRKSLIEQTKADVPDPILVLDIKEKEIWTNKDPVLISGVAKDENYIERIMIKDAPYFQESARKNLSFKKELDLEQGSHTIKISAKNLPGRHTQKQIIIHVDREGPVLSLENLELKETSLGNTVEISGWIHDAANVASIEINGKSVPIEKGDAVFFNTTLEVQGNQLDIITSDTLENKTRASISLGEKTASRFPVMVAGNDMIDQGMFLAGIFGTKNSRPPAIKLKNISENQVTFLEKAYFEGQVSDENSIVKLSINSESVLKRKGRFVFFSHMAALLEGENVLKIEAEDEDGNKSSKKITIVRKIPKAKQLSERLTLTALPFNQEDGVSQKGLAFQDSLTDAFINRQRFKMVERSRLEAILQEQKIGTSSLIDRDTAIEIGNLLAAQSVITGGISETRKGIEVVARLIDTETSDILSAQDVYSEGKDLRALSLLANGMTLKFHRDFPVLEGVVVSKKGNTVFTDLGQGAVKLQRRLIIYRDKAVDKKMNNGQVGADQEVLGTARVTQVMDQMSKAKINDTRGSEINDMDRVITK